MSKNVSLKIRHLSSILPVVFFLLSACAPDNLTASPINVSSTPAASVVQSSSTQSGVARPTTIALPTCPSSTATGCVKVTPLGGNGNIDLSHGTCEGSGPAKLSASPMKLSDIALIQPMGLMVGGHVTPIDHQYYLPANFRSAPDTYEIYSALDGYIVNVGIEKEQVNPPDKISLFIEGSCTFWVWYNLLTSLTPELTQQALSKPGENSPVRIPIKAGQLLGYIGGRTLDFAVIDSEITLSGFIIPEHYASESWKIHIVDPFDYFDEPIRTQLLSLDARSAEPRGGKIDYDVDGRLIGNWFVENTNGYAGFFPDQPRPLYYSASHLAIVPDAIDPSAFTISIGSLLLERQNQFGILGNAPDPSQVSVKTGHVVYELVQIDWVDANGQRWDNLHYTPGVHRSDGQQVIGTVLVQMLDDRHLKFEVFMGKRASQVNGFTGAAQIYER